MEYLKIEWWNSCDLADIVYSVKLTLAGVINGDYHNVVYLDVDVKKPEYTIDEEAQENHEQTVIIQNQKWTKKYRCEYKAPEFMADALTAMQLHDNIWITLPEDDPRKVKEINVSVEWPEAGGYECFANIIIEWSFENIIKTACCENAETLYYEYNGLTAATVADGYVSSAGSYFNNVLYVRIGQIASTFYEAWYHFSDIDIPQGATIIEAKMKFYGYASVGDDVNARIRLNDSDNAVAPANFAAFVSLAATTAYTNWNDIDTWVANQVYYTPDIASAVQEVVDRTGWTSGNAMMLIVQYVSATNGHYRHAYSYDGSGGSKKASLLITYKLH